MLEMISRWYKRRFSDPHAASLVAILLIGFIIIYFFGHLIAPLLVAIVLAYLLEWPVLHLHRFGVPENLGRRLGHLCLCRLNVDCIVWFSTDHLGTNW